MAGATLDAVTAGLSLGTATLLGAAAGGLWQGADKLGKRMLGKLKGYQELSVDDAVLRLLALLQLALGQAIEEPVHAAHKRKGKRTDALHRWTDRRDGNKGAK